MLDNILVKVKKQNSQPKTEDLLSPEIKNLEEKSALEPKGINEAEINLSRLAFECDLDLDQKKNFKELVEALKNKDKINSNILAFYYQDLPPAILQHPEVRSLVEEKLTETILRNDNIGSRLDYIEHFGVSPNFFTDKKFDSYRKNHWEDELKKGKNINFKTGRIETNLFYLRDKDEEEIDDLLEGNFQQAKKLFTPEELQTLGLEGSIAAVSGSDSISPPKIEERIARFNSYKEQFLLKPDDLETAVLENIKNNILNIQIPDEVINQYAAAKKFIESPAAKNLAIKTAVEEIALGHDVDNALKKFQISNSELDQAEIIKQVNKNINEDKIKYYFIFDNFQKYLDDEHLSQLGGAVLNLRDDLKKEFLERYFSRSGWTHEKSEGHQKNLDNFKKLKLPKELLVNYAQDIIIRKVKANDYSKEKVDAEQASYSFFGVEEKEKQEALSIGYLKYALSNQIWDISDKEDFAQKKIGLDKFAFTPKFRAELKKEYLAAIKNGETSQLKQIELFLEKENEQIPWQDSERPGLREAAEEGIINVCDQGREAIKAFADKYYPDRHKIFLFAQPVFKEKVSNQLINNIIRSTRDNDSWYNFNHQKLTEAGSYFNLDTEDLFKKAEKNLGFLATRPAKTMSELFPQFNAQEHNDRWISEQNPETLIYSTINGKNVELLRALAQHENTKDLLKTELANTEKNILNTSLVKEATNAESERNATNIWLLKNSFADSELAKCISGEQTRKFFFNADAANSLLILKHLNSAPLETREDSALVNLMSKDNTKIQELIKEVEQCVEIGALSHSLEQKLQSDFAINLENFEESNQINAEKLLQAIRESIQENFYDNLKPQDSESLTNINDENKLLEKTELAVLSGEKKINNEDTFSKIYNNYLGRVGKNKIMPDLEFSKVINKKMTGREDIFFENQEWGLALMEYVKMMEGENGTEARRTKISNVFSGSYKDVCLNQMNADWKEFLGNKDKQEIPFKLQLITNTINYYGGAGNLSQIENFSGLISQVKDSSENKNTSERTKGELKTVLNNAELRFDKEKWSQDDRADFYGLAKDIIEASPSLFCSFSPIFENMSGKEIKQFVKEMLPLYQAELITMQQEADNNGEIKYNARDLVPVRRSIEHLISDLKAQPEKKEEILNNEKNNLLEITKLKFKERFGILNVPEELSNEEFRSLHNFVRYTGNINGRNESRETLISFYLALRLNGDWDKFRRGEKIEVDKYLSVDKAALIKPALDGKAKNSLPLETVGINEKQASKFQENLQAEVSSNMVGNIETVDVKLGNAKRNIDELLDPDIYDNPQDKALIPLLEKHHKAIGTVLAKSFQILSGRAIELSSEEKNVQQELSNALNIGAWSLERIKTIQERIQPLSLINNLVKRMEESAVEDNINELNRRLQPNEKIIEIFNHLDENFKTGSGAMAISRDLEYLENLVVKEEGRIEPAEKKEVQDYISSIREKMAELEKLMDSTKEYFNKIKGSAHASGQIENVRLKNRIDEIEKIINSQSTEAVITSEMTKDPNLIIENMRQCLGCLHKEINNDTNLAFGDYNKFFMISRKERSKGSVADQIIFFVPTKSENGEEKMSFVMDRIYGSKSSDILTAHVLTVYKKYKNLKEKFPEAKISISISAEAMSSAGIDAETLKKHLTEKEPKLKSAEFMKDLIANVPASSFSDNYIEFGDGGARKSGERKFNALVIG